MTVRGTRGVANIVDDDERSVTIGFDQSDYTVMEGESVEVCVWMTAGSVGQPFSVQVSTELSSNINISELI